MGGASLSAEAGYCDDESVRIGDPVGTPAIQFISPSRATTMGVGQSSEFMIQFLDNPSCLVILLPQR